LDDQPRLLKYPEFIARRRAELTKEHIAPLAKFAESLRKCKMDEIPDFDPWDGGTRARALFLFEKPSSKAAASGFISRNNDDQTAENIFNFMVEAEIPRKKVCIWNVVPGWNGKRKVTDAELDAGVRALRELFPLLSRLTVVVFVGKKAARALPLLDGTLLKIDQSPHPSPQVKGRYRGQWDSIPIIWRRVREFIGCDENSN
jgi:hypothetical protein